MMQDDITPAGQLIGHVGLWPRPNRDGSLTYTLRWRVSDGQGGAKVRIERACKTERKPTATSTREWERQARMLAFKKEQELRDPDSPGTAMRITLPEAANHHLSWAEGDGSHAPPIAGSTLDARFRVVWGFVEYVQAEYADVQYVKALTRKHTASWAHWRAAQVADSTRNTELAHLGAFLRYCRDHGFTDRELPLRDHRAPIGEALPMAIEDHEVRGAIFSQQDPIRRAALFTLAATGMRNRELVGLCVRGWDAANRILTIPKAERERTKRHGRRFPMGDYAARLIEDVQASRDFREQGAPLLPGIRPPSLGNWLRPMGLVPKQFRQWFCSTLERLDAEDRVIDALMGHAGSKTRRAYSFRLSDARPSMAMVEAILTAPEGAQDV